MASKICECFRRCCKYRRRLQAEARSARQSAFPSGFSDSATPLRLSEVVVSNNGYESDYFDARSEASDDMCECELGICADGSSEQARGTLNAPPYRRSSSGSSLSNGSFRSGNDSPRGSPDPPVNQAEQLLRQVRNIERRCRGNVAGDNDELYSVAEEDKTTVECILRDDTTKFWVCHTPNCPIVTACAYFYLANTKMEDACDAIRLPKERLTWDTMTLKELEVIGDGDIEDPASGQIVRCVVIAPKPLKDREMLQRRWQLPLPNGGQAFVLRSFDDSKLLPDRPELYVRAFTHLSGYLLRPLDANGKSGVELTMISRSDIGGLVPMWVQNIVRRLAKREIVKWAKKLHSHCDKLAIRRAERAQNCQQGVERRLVSMEVDQPQT